MVTRFCLVFLVNAAVEVCVRIVPPLHGVRLVLDSGVWLLVWKCVVLCGHCDVGGVFTIIYHLGFMYYRGRVEAGYLRRQFPYEVSGLNSAASVFSWYNNPSSRVLY